MGRRSAVCAGAVTVLLLGASTSWATWSIILADTETKEVAVGTVTCLNQFDLLALVPVVVVGKGGGAVQSFGDFEGIRRPIIFDQLMLGTPPQEILQILAGVTGHQFRQYGIADTQARAVTFSGEENGAWAGGVTGSGCSMYYAIQGNVLAGACVVDAIEQAVRDTPGDMPAKLMAGMQAAREQGGDGRCSCTPNNPELCGCPVPSFVKSGHIGGMVVARIGDSDDPLCDVAGCADGDYFMGLNVAFQDNADLDPVLQLQAQFDAWRANLVGRSDAVQTAVGFDPPGIPANGTSTTEMRVTPLDWQGASVQTAIESLTVEHAADSAGLSSIGPVVGNADGSFSVTMTAGTSTGIDRFVVTIDDGVRPVLLTPEPALEYCGTPLCELDCNNNGLPDSCDLGNGTSHDCNSNHAPDECDVSSMGSADCNVNLVPDECEADCNGNRVVDACDIASETSPDVDGNCVPDECHAILRVPANYADMQTAIAAAVPGDTVFVAPGVYTGTGNRNLDFGGRDILLKCETGPQECVLDCEAAGRGLIFQSGETGSAAVEGFTITHGLINRGSAIYCDNNSSPTIRNCVMVENTATDQGGALWSRHSRPLLLRCRIAGNVAQGVRGGGGIYANSPLIGAAPMLHDCLLAFNTANNGGAIYALGSDVMLNNCTIVGNTAMFAGGALFVTAAGETTMRHCVLWQDVATNGMEVFLADDEAVVSASYSDVQGGPASVGGIGIVVWGQGNLGEDPVLHDPLFAAPAGASGDYRLLQGSPCIETGDPAFIPYPGETDLDGHLRLLDADDSGLATVDMGAYEFQVKVSCPSDLSGDGVVNSRDLALLLGAWGPNPGHPADLNFDGVVNVIDLAALLQTWGECKR